RIIGDAGGRGRGRDGAGFRAQQNDARNERGPDGRCRETAINFPHVFSSISYFSITVLASSFSHMSLSEARALAASVSARSRSITLPWRTSPTAAKPSPFSAWPIALPCGSKTPFLSVTKTLAFIGRAGGL